MGRDKGQGQKNLVRMLGNQRYVKVFFTKGSSRVSMTTTNANYERFVMGLARRGYAVESVEDRS